MECRSCGKVKVKRGKLNWLADNPLYTKRFAFFVGRRCRASTIKDVAEELHLDCHTVKELDKQYMREQLRRQGMPRPKVLGIDEVSIRKGHKYRIVVSDLERHRPIWFGGKDRSESSMDEFYQWLGPARSKRIRLAVYGHVEAIPQVHPQGRACTAGQHLVRQVSHHAAPEQGSGSSAQEGVRPAIRISPTRSGVSIGGRAIYVSSRKSALRVIVWVNLR